MLVGVDFIRLFNGVHIEVTVAGLRTGGATISAAAREAGEEKEGGKIGNLGIWEKGRIGEGFSIESEVEGGKGLGIGKERRFEVVEG